MELDKICLITDIHLSREGEMANEVDTRKNFQTILDKVVEENPLHVIIAGDICFREADEGVYQWTKDLLLDMKIDYSCIAGNHDNSHKLAKILHPELQFNHETNELYYVKYISGKKFIFLDTAIGEMSAHQWKWFDAELKGEDQIFIVMHHPPIFCGVPHMDNHYAFKQMDQFGKVCAANDASNKLIFTGHYHVERSVKTSDYDLFITPSCFVQIDDRYEDFVADHYIPAYRNIYLGEGYFNTTVRYLV